MRRREFISLIAGVALTSLPFRPITAQPQPKGKTARLGFLSAYPAETGKTLVGCFRKGLEQLDWIEGRNISIEYRWVGDRPERYAAFAAELVALKPDLIACNSTPAAQALARATPSIPIVFMSVSDPVASGIVSNLSHPQGNITGVSNYLSATAGKLLELFKTASPNVSRVLVLYDHANAGKALEVRELQASAPALGLALDIPQTRNGDDIARAISAISETSGAGIVALTDGVTNANRGLIIELAAKARLPVISETREFVGAGALLSYGLDFCDHFRRAASYVDKLLKGARPSDLPVELPTKFQLAINLKAARTLGVTIPHNMIALADEVIE